MKKRSVTSRAVLLGTVPMLLAFLAAFTIAAAIIGNRGDGADSSMLIAVLGAWMLGAAVIFTLIITIVAVRTSSGIANDVNGVDPENPIAYALPEEFAPLASKISRQNRSYKKLIAEHESRASEYLSILTNLQEGIIVLNAMGELISVNDVAKRVLSIEGAASGSVLALGLDQSINQVIRAALMGEGDECYIELDDRHYSILSAPIMKSGNPSGAVLFVIDDTEKEERFALRSEFTSNVSHELKTPLTSISGFAELIKEGMAVGDDAVNCARHIYKESARLIRLVEDIINLSKVDGGEIPFDPEPVSISSVAETVAESLRSVAERAGVSIYTHLSTDAAVRGNSHIIDEMIYNLTDNAIKYNREGGEVHISLLEKGDNILLCVRDTGIGIPKDKQGRVFERFYRIDKSHSKEIGGTGLGLSIVKHGANYHKAQIMLKSELGVGTEITVSFPKISQ